MVWFKRFLSIAIIVLLFINCSSDNAPTSLSGKWKLVQVLADPGDGSGIFRDIQSNKTIEFFSDETFDSNGNLCFFQPIDEVTTQGAYSEDKNEIYPNTCNSFVGVVLNYKLEKNTLIITYQCIEACAEKYVKIE